MYTTLSPLCESTAIRILRGKARRAYVAPATAGVLLLGAIAALLAAENAHPAILMLCVGAAIGVGHRLLALHTYRLWFDETGVWECRGLLRKTRLCRGLRWRDIARAVWEPPLLDWPRGTGAVRIHHRTYRNADLLCSHLVDGRQFVAELNRERQRQMVSITLSTGPSSRARTAPSLKPPLLRDEVALSDVERFAA